MDPRTARERRRGRELAAQMLSSWDANPGSPPATVAGVRDLTRASETHLEFAEALANAAWARLDEIDRCLDETIKPFWKENMGRVERSVLRVAVAELLTASAPPRVVIERSHRGCPPLRRRGLHLLRPRGPGRCRQAARDDGGSGSCAGRRNARRRAGLMSEAPTERESAMNRDERDRRRKLAEIESLGVPAWPNRFAASHTLEQASETYGDLDGAGLDAAPEADRTVRVAGRIVAIRSFGKAAFLRLSEGPGTLQVHVRRDVLSERDFAVAKQLDLGDWVGVAGPMFRTRTGELTVRADSLAFLAKALLPPPEKWHGLTDRDTRYRQRYLDLLGNPRTREVFRSRAAMVSAMRRFMESEGFLEVETPMLQPLATGAAARPFQTRHRALGIDLYLRVAPELYLKRLVVGGFPRVYEINRNFRNEGLSTRHNPEFTMLEFYRAFSDCADMMELTERLVIAAAGASTAW